MTTPLIFRLAPLIAAQILDDRRYRLTVRRAVCILHEYACSTDPNNPRYQLPPFDQHRRYVERCMAGEEPADAHYPIVWCASFLEFAYASGRGLTTVDGVEKLCGFCMTTEVTPARLHSLSIHTGTLLPSVMSPAASVIFRLARLQRTDRYQPTWDGHKDPRFIYHAYKDFTWYGRKRGEPRYRIDSKPDYSLYFGRVQTTRTLTFRGAAC